MKTQSHFLRLAKFKTDLSTRYPTLQTSNFDNVKFRGAAAKILSAILLRDKNYICPLLPKYSFLLVGGIISLRKRQHYFHRHLVFFISFSVFIFTDKVSGVSAPFRYTQGIVTGHLPPPFPIPFPRLRRHLPNEQCVTCRDAFVNFAKYPQCLITSNKFALNS